MSTAPDVDRGLQPQRTHLAWTRTALSSALLFSVIGRRAVTSSAWTWFPLALAGVMSVAFVVVARARTVHLESHARPAPLSPGTAATVAGAVLSTAAFALVTTLVTR